jgi:hypothetical protein
LTPLADDMPGLAPLSDDAPGLTPLADEAAGLTPLSGDSPGLTLLPEDSGGLTCEPASGGLTPLAGDTGLTPLGSDPLGTAQPGLDPLSSPGGGNANPFSDAYAPAATPAYSPRPQAPYRAPRRRTGLNEWVVKAPAIAMMAVSGSSLLFVIPFIIINVVAGAGGGLGAPGHEEAKIAYGVGAVFGLLMIVLVFGLMIFGGYKMFRAESWGFALTGAILMVIPCVYCGMGLVGFFAMAVGVPVGIWAIVVLSLSDVRRAFD